MKKYIDKSLMIEAMLGSAVLCTIAFLLQSDFGFGWADEGLLWYASQRTHAGELAIRDFFAYDPGRYYWNSIFFSILGDAGLHRLLVAAATFGGLGLAVSWYTMGVAKVNIAWRLFFAILITIALGYPRHKVYEQSLSLLLVALVYFVLVSPSSNKRWFVFGLFTGVAAVFGRNHGVFFVVCAILCALYLLLSRKLHVLPRVSVSYLSGIFAGYSPILLLLIFDLGFRNAFIKSVLSILEWQLSLPIPFFWTVNYSGELNFDVLHALAIGLMCVLVPVTYLAGALLLYKNVNSTSTRRSAILLLGASSLAGIPYLHQAFDRADFGHIAQATLPIFVAYSAIISICFDAKRLRVLSLGACFIALVILLAAWLPSLPASRMLRMEALYPGSTVKHAMGGREFIIDKYQSTVLDGVRNIAEQCRIGDKEFLALPHFPGVYAYLGLKAPFWEMYYLYQRSPEFQLRHIDAISSVRLILISPEATADGLERLKLKNTYGLLLTHIEKRFTKINSVVLPNGVFLYVDPKSCNIHN